MRKPEKERERKNHARAHGRHGKTKPRQIESTRARTNGRIGPKERETETQRPGRAGSAVVRPNFEPRYLGHFSFLVELLGDVVGPRGPKPFHHPKDGRMVVSPVSTAPETGEQRQKLIFGDRAPEL